MASRVPAPPYPKICLISFALASSASSRGASCARRASLEVSGLGPSYRSSGILIRRFMSWISFSCAAFRRLASARSMAATASMNAYAKALDPFEDDDSSMAR